MLQDIDPVKVQIEVPERDVARVGSGNVVRLTSDAYPGRQFSGKVARVVARARPAHPHDGHRGRHPQPETTCSSPACTRGSISCSRFARTPCWCRWRRSPAPRAEPTVLVVREGKVARRRSSSSAPPTGPRVQVIKGLAPDAQVILQGKELVRDGMTVKAVPAKAY